jgi:hypothetical protein
MVCGPFCLLTCLKKTGARSARTRSTVKTQQCTKGRQIDTNKKNLCSHSLFNSKLVNSAVIYFLIFQAHELYVFLRRHLPTFIYLWLPLFTLKITNLHYTLTLFSRDNSIVHGFSLDIEKDIMLRNIVWGFKCRLFLMTDLTASPSTWTGIVFVVTILAVLHWTIQ